MSMVAREFRKGVIDCWPFVFVVLPFAILFGVVASEAGLTLPQIIGFSVLVVGGASQFAALQLMTENATLALVVASGLAVNLRMAMYSASLVPWLGKAPLWQRVLIAYLLFDNTYAVSLSRYEDQPQLSLAERASYFLGLALLTTCFWYGGTVLGVLIGASIPESFALDFALPLTFVALLAPMVRTLAHLAAAGTSVLVALVLAGLPSGVGLMIAGVVAMMVGAAVEQRMGRAS